MMFECLIKGDHSSARTKVTFGFQKNSVRLVLILDNQTQYREIWFEAEQSRN